MTAVGGPAKVDSPTPKQEELQIHPFDGTVGEWDGLLANLDGSSFCHLGAWRTVMADVLGHQPLYRIARDRWGGVYGLLPMVRVRSRLFGDYLVSMPFLSYGGPLGTERARKLLAQEAAQEAERLKVDLLELRSRIPVPGHLRTTHRRLTVLLPLPEVAETLWKTGFKAKLRSQIRRPLKEGMETRTGPSERDAFYAVFSRTMRDLGTPVLPRHFFEVLAREFPDQVIFCSIWWKGDPVAAGCGFFWGKEVEITWAGGLREHSRMAPNMLLYWSFIQEAIRLGAETFNFGRCSPNSGTHRFKRQWGGQDTLLPWAQWSKGGADSTPTPTGRKYELATAVWRSLPLPVAEFLGPRISRSLP